MIQARYIETDIGCAIFSNVQYINKDIIIKGQNLAVTNHNYITMV